MAAEPTAGPCEASQASRAAAAPPKPITAASTSGRGPVRPAEVVGARSAWSSTSRAVSAPDSGTSTSRGPAARKSGTSKPGVRRRMLGTPHSSRSAWMNSASVWLRPPATRTSLPSVNAGSILRARPWASLSGASSGSAPGSHERHAAARAEARPRLVLPAAARAGEPPIRRRRRRAPPPRPSVGDPPQPAPPAPPPATRSGSASAG